MIGEDGYITDEDRYIIDEDGFIIDEDEYIMDEHRYFIDEDGFIIDEDGYTMDEDGYFIDEDEYIIDEHSRSRVSVCKGDEKQVSSILLLEAENSIDFFFARHLTLLLRPFFPISPLTLCCLSQYRLFEMVPLGQISLDSISVYIRVRMRAYVCIHGSDSH